MRYPGQPKPPPGWYRDRGQSYIENQFSSALEDFASLIESEIWFGDAEKHGRYRVDFILRDARIIIELDGHEYHSTKEQLERDAIRQRYLTRAGYSVIRFTGREINNNPTACVTEVRTIYNERMQRAPSNYRVLYIDYQFLVRQMADAKRFYQKMHPTKRLDMPSLEDFVPHAIDWLHEKSFIAAFVFLPPEERYYVEKFDGLVRQYEKGEIRINIIDDDFYSIELGNHMVSFSHLYDSFYLVADDFLYINPFQSILSEKTKQSGKLLRRGNEETAYVGTDLASVPWQHIWYPVGAAMGLGVHEL